LLIGKSTPLILAKVCLYYILNPLASFHQEGPMKSPQLRRLIIILGLAFLAFALMAFVYTSLPNARQSGVYPLQPEIHTPAGQVP
jgi:hypothetical protein